MERIALESDSYSDLLRKLDLGVTGGNQKTLMQRLSKFEISVEHFEHRRWNWDRRRKDLKDILVKDSTYLSSNTLKKRLIAEGILEEKCASCNIGPEWNNQHLTLELDHIDGDNRNNELSNLRILCPNCHSQTETFGGKSQVREKKIHRCEECNDVVYRQSKLCHACSSKRSRKTERPAKVELERLILQYPMVKIGAMYGVSDNAVRKWCKGYGIEMKKK